MTQSEQFPAHSTRTTWQMRSIATAFLESLDIEQRRLAIMPFDDEAERRDWDFIPKQGRGGLPLRLMTNHQQSMAQSLIAASMSLRTYSKVLQIMANENILREIQGPRLGLAASDFRNAGNYYFSFFGKPNMEATWGWRVVGHHVSLNFTIVNGVHLSATPSLLGMEPAEIGVMRPLQDEQVVGFELLQSLSDTQLAGTVIHNVAPPNFATRVVPRIGSEELPGDHELGFDQYVISDEDREKLKYVKGQPSGIAYRDLDDGQQSRLRAIIDCYLSRMSDEHAAIEHARILEHGLDNIGFCWAGQTELRKPHYYRVQGPSFLIEFENAQSGGDHIHSLWRDPENDFGEDILRRHHAEAHSQGKLPFILDRVTSSRA